MIEEKLTKGDEPILDGVSELVAGVCYPGDIQYFSVNLSNAISYDFGILAYLSLLKEMPGIDREKLSKIASSYRATRLQSIPETLPQEIKDNMSRTIDGVFRSIIKSMTDYKKHFFNETRKRLVELVDEYEAVSTRNLPREEIFERMSCSEQYIFECIKEVYKTLHIIRSNKRIKNPEKFDEAIENIFNALIGEKDFNFTIDLGVNDHSRAYQTGFRTYQARIHSH